MTMLLLDSLSKRYGALVVTDSFSFEVAQGEFVGILGPNGAGKTTLFNLIAGTVKPDTGTITFQSRDITREGAAARCRSGISRSFQIPHPFVGMTVFENVLVGATFGRKAEGSVDYAMQALELSGLSKKANQLAGSLPLLGRKRLELARALATEPRLLLLDEIAGGLTESECHELLDVLRQVHASGVTIVWIEHVVRALLSVAQRLVVVNFGKKIADGAPDKVMDSSEVKSVYLGEDALV
ncbi:ABC transporter ATP-binding protein [Mesorhizobium newzealandense]|uniref:ABC transporter ATP-binding protein n=2 Tax=Mesorhizobium TaxID=68287 RepID=A0ABW4WCU6_9HYPH|nr:ABC transporter ATP-binding protein [Mesorhizobium sophorae]